MIKKKHFFFLQEYSKIHHGPSSQYLWGKCTRTRWIFKIDFLENKALLKKILFFIFDSFSREESHTARWYYILWDTLYVFI